MPKSKKNSKSEKPSNEETSELFHVRDVVSSRLERFNKYLDNSDVNIIQLEVRLKSIEDDFTEFDRCQTRLEYLNPDEIEFRNEIEEKFYTLIGRAKTYIKNDNETREIKTLVNTENRTVTNSGAVAKLPDIELPTFHGNYDTWLSFKDLFNSVVDRRTDLKDVDKFLYLKLCCKDDAQKIIESLESTGDNYKVAKELLEKRYDNKRVIINHHVNSLIFNLPEVNKESAQGLRKLLDTFNQHIRNLEKLKLPIEHWDALLIPIILSKVDNRTKREWELKQTDQRLPTLNELTDFLTKKCFTLEAVHMNDFVKSNAQNHNLQVKVQNKESFRKMSCHTTSYNNNFNNCILCKEKHFIYQCPKFSNLSLKEKYFEINKSKLCSNCLRAGHSKQDCRSSGCKKCNLKHNTALHVDNYKNHYQSIRSKQPSDLAENSNVAIGQAILLAKERESSESNENHSGISQAINNSNKFSDKQQALCTLETNNHSNAIFNNKLDLNTAQSFSYTTLSSSQVLLSTATILIKNNNQGWVKCTALLDSGSQPNLISESLCNKLNLKREKINVPLGGINQIQTNISNKTKAKIKSRLENYETELTFLILPRITEKLPSIGFEKLQINYPKNINLADEQFNVPKEIDLLLGAGIFFDLLKDQKIKLGVDLPVLQETRLGWVITGNLFVDNHANKKILCNLSINNITNKELHVSLTKFWQLEELPQQNKLLSKNEQYCENNFQNTTRKDETGKFIVTYPFTQNYENKLGDSKITALQRFTSLESRLNKNENLKTQYVNFMHEYETLNHMTLKCNFNEDNSIVNQSFFLPHSAVFKDSLTTKCRVVFDASSKSSTNVSLNDLLLTGPTIQSELFSLLLRLRLREFILIADIKMMYRCILIEPNERDFQQILWRYNTNEPIKVYKLNTVTYGTSSAPYQATRCLKELAIQNHDKFPRTSQIIENSFYMDDLLLSVNTISEAKEIYHEITDILSKAGFELRKWSSNNISILDYILNSSKNKDENNLVLYHDKEFKTLGVTWDPSSDLLKYSINIKFNENNITKRQILSAISQIFDPLGLIGPVVIKAKLIIQKLWCLKISWDQEVPENVKIIWLNFASELHILNQIKIDRHVLDKNSIRVELYGFSDSSEKAYGACIYLCSTKVNGKRKVRLLTAKSKVAPLKKVTIPRLELLAALLLAELVHKIKSILDIDINQTTYFTDSTIVLAWLKLEPSLLKPFVSNRVSKIIELSNVSEWKHIQSKDNPADIISRGLNPKELVNCEMWFSGPNFLKNDCIYQLDKDIIINVEKLPELKPQTITLNVTNSTGNINWFEKYSDLNKLQRIISYIYRFKNRSKNSEFFKSTDLTVQELNESLLTLIRLAQREQFQSEISKLEKSQILNDSKIRCLQPILDNKGILRVGGRLSNSDLDFDQQHPIILPYKHKLTDLIIRKAHIEHLHAGVQNLLNILRLKFWPVNGKSAVKRITGSCIRCFRAKPKQIEYLMGSLPRDRVKLNRPFSVSGVDYAGPIYVKEGTRRSSKLIKTYICIFVCFATRATHIELVPDLTTDSFLNALKRFCSRRGKPSDIYSDNGSNFVGANNRFLELYELLNNDNRNSIISSFLVNMQINWHFNPAYAPHMGGLWEAAVKSTKFHLRRVLGTSNLNYDEMNTLLTQIESCLNSRPITPLSNDINDFLPLTPAHFLIGSSLASIPQINLQDVKIHRLSRYQRLQQLYQQFWDRWYKEYVTSLQNRHKWTKTSTSQIEVGMLVILVEDNIPPLCWPLARVTKLHPGSDNVVRVVSVRLPNGTELKRSARGLCVLPINSTFEK